MANIKGKMKTTHILRDEIDEKYPYKNKKVLMRFTSVICLLTLVLLFALSCSKKDPVDYSQSGEYIESFIQRLKENEKPATEQFSQFQNALEETENATDSSMQELFRVLRSGFDLHTIAIEQFQGMATEDKPAFLDDSLAALLNFSALSLALAYDSRLQALQAMNRYLGIRNRRFFDEYVAQLNTAKEASTQAFQGINAVRLRQKVYSGDTLDMSIQEYLGIPPETTDSLQNIIKEEIDTIHSIIPEK